MMKKLLQGFLDYKIIFKYWLLFLLIGFLFRLTLSLIFLESYNDEMLYGFIYGARMDTMMYSLFTFAVLILYALNFVVLVRVFFTFYIFIYLFMEVATIIFMEKFFTRPNYLFIEHLHNYDEILTMVWKLYTVQILIAIPIILYFTYKIYHYFSRTLDKSSVGYKLIALPLMLAILFLGGRSSVDASTPNPSFYTFSSHKINNEIANNSFFSLIYALYSLKKEKSFYYGDMTDKEAIENVKRINNIQNDTLSLSRFQKSMFEKKKNIIIVILESFGHSYVGHLGGTPTTPNLDKLTKESLYFTNLYATGTRTGWGVSSVVASQYPIPSRPYVKATKSQKDFYTIASTLKKHNYTNTFLYSGDADFDNMKGFLLSNGYDYAYGQESFSSDKHKYTWGYCDEDLYEKAYSIIEASKGKPFFLTLLTMSSHEPYDYPKDKVTPFEGAKLNSFANSIKYADYAIGKFMEKLKENNFLENTVVAFIADHNGDAYSTFDLPIDKYKILALITSDDFKGGREYKKVASQIDFAPTILDIAGISDTIPSMGGSVLQNERDSAIVLAHRKNYAYLLKDSFVVYKDKTSPKTYDYALKELQDNPQDIKDGLSYIQSTAFLYNTKESY